jgi:hypothetical protein
MLAVHVAQRRDVTASDKVPEILPVHVIPPPLPLGSMNPRFHKQAKRPEDEPKPHRHPPFTGQIRKYMPGPRKDGQDTRGHATMIIAAVAKGKPVRRQHTNATHESCPAKKPQ